MAAMITTIAGWLIFFLAAALEIYGFATTGILRQQMWSPLGLIRLTSFAAGYGAIAAVTLLWRPGLCAPLLLGMAFAWTVAAFGVLPVLVVALFLLASFELGKRIEPVDRILALLTGIAIYSFVQGLLAHVAMNSAVSAVALLAIPLILNPRSTGKSLQMILGKMVEFGTPDRRKQSALVWAGAPLAAQFLVALKPEVSTDGLAMHLVIPSFTALHHYWGFDFRQAMWAVMPMGGDWCYTIVYLIGGEGAARILNGSLLVILAALVFVLCRRFLSRGGAAVLTALFVSTPLAQLVTGSLFVENFWTVLVVGGFAALLRAHESGRNKGLYICAILLGVAISAKFGAIAFAAPFALIAGTILWRRDNSSGRLTVALAVLVLLVVLAAPPYLTAYVKTGNPVFPYLNNVFPSPYIDPAFFSRDIRFERPMDLRFPYDVTFHTGRYIEGLSGAAGFQYLLLVPLCLVLLVGRNSFAGWTALLSGLLGCYLMFLQQTNVRYAIPGMAMMTIAFAAAMGRFGEQGHFRRLIMSCCVVLTVVNVYFAGASGYLHRDFWLNPLNKNEWQSYLTNYAPVRGLVDYLNRTAPGEPAMFIATNQIAGFNGPALTSTWHNRPFALRLGKAESAGEILRIANDFHTRYFISPVAESAALSLPTFEQFRTAFTEPEYRNGTFYLSRLKNAGNDAAVAETLQPMPQELSPVTEPAVVLAVGDYDDGDNRLVYHGRWAHDAPYPKAYGSTISFSNAIGASVEFSFTGSEVTYVYTRANNCGKASVTIDGKAVETIDGYASDSDWQVRKTWSGLVPGAHRVQIRVLPEKNPASEGFFVGIDAVNIR
jgi:hypothetical protein